MSFLAIHVGAAIYGEVPPLTAIRTALANGSLKSSHIHMERLSAERPAPFHGLIVEQNRPYTVLQMRLFGQIAFRTTLRRLSFQGERLIYTHDLATNVESMRRAEDHS
jgi:hypothetical protein